MNVYQIHDSGHGYGASLAIVTANSPQEAIGVLAINGDDYIFYHKDFITKLLIDVQYNGVIPCVICKRGYYE